MKLPPDRKGMREMGAEISHDLRRVVKAAGRR
jgi:hypothetical protein